MSTILAALLIGVVAGMRAMTAPGGGELGGRAWMDPGRRHSIGFLANRFTPWVFTLLALGEFVTNQLPTTPSRTVPLQFGTRLVLGAGFGRRNRSLRRRPGRRRHRRRAGRRVGHTRWPLAPRSPGRPLRERSARGVPRGYPGGRTRAAGAHVGLRIDRLVIEPCPSRSALELSWEACDAVSPARRHTRA